MLRFIALILTAVFAIGTAYAQDSGLSNAARRAPYYDGLKGKKVVFVPLSMGFDLTEGWAAIMRRQAADLGYTFEIRDPNWSTDAGTRALTSLIAQKPDLVIVHNPDVQSYARPIKRLEQAGIKVLQVNLESALTTDSYVGADWVKVGYVEADALVKKCGPGTSGKIAIMQGVPTAASNLYELYAYHDTFSKHPNIKIVSEQAANYDPAKARAIMETVLQQNPDLCGVVGNWDNQDVGAGAAIQQAGKTGQVYVVTSGGGTADGCENIRKGLLDMTVSYNVPLQGDILNQQIVELLLSPAKAGTVKNTYYTPLTILTKDNLTPRNCWSLNELK
ncbi:sugar ABC transporter substrate-binding protein [Acidisoma cellulosilytica]|uniref:Sugar ABC transporter substrate-binding protein n=1 Tax=Acidisoma cellulosilyticum TaxID=2802395 RepID=A0A963Z641_9PROT|nr:sugar ABC transporter substrate-binding protein [Acidisoma cellulosilyticum]MCB8882552.1 sugar ABC transporter substrate-binding protein [Acidisoma cellulosilyticum]